MPQNLTVSSVSATSAKLSWSLPDEVGRYPWSNWGKKDPYSFLISYHSEKSGTNQSSTGDNSTEITGLTPYTEYTVSVCTVKKHGVQSSPASSRFYTVLPAPEKVTVVSVSATSAKISWILPHGMDQIPHSFLISYWSKESKIESISTDSSRTDITELKPDTPYTLTVCTEFKHGGRSQETSTNIHTSQVPAPENLSVEVKITSVSVRWSKPAGVDQVSYLLSYSSEGEEEQTISTESLHHSLHDLLFCTEYKIRVCTVLNNLHHSKPVKKTFSKTVPAPEKVTVVSVSATSAKISWIPPHGMDQIPRFWISYWIKESKPDKPEPISTDSSIREITELKPDTPYTLTVCTEVKHGGRSQPATVNFNTDKFRFYTKNIGKLPIQNTQSLKELLTRNGLVEVNSVKKCDVVLAFCLVVSRAGTDIEAALAEINKETKPAILVVMHHTFRTDVFPDSSRFVRGEQVVLTVDCLFYEGQGLLRCQQNDTAFTQIQNSLAHLVNKYTPSKQETSAGREDHV